MTPDDRSLAALWLSELWPVVREHHQTRDEKADAEARNAALDGTRGEPELPWRVA